MRHDTQPITHLLVLHETNLHDQVQENISREVSPLRLSSLIGRIGRFDRRKNEMGGKISISWKGGKAHRPQHRNDRPTN